ncbi:MAG: methyltransferase domain-containing protein [Candidatus Cloacimonetes bacterium]|jgi:SAM-dependent methyltransferase|nr:methyltransferase domain-containing protein [Candidatus Cloacimonadota bacterium]
MIKDFFRKQVSESTYYLFKDLYKFISSLRYYGHRFYCPICNGNFVRFLSIGHNIPVIKTKEIIGAGYRENAACPRCYSTDRTRLIYLFLKHYKPEFFTAKFKLLHIAPEISFYRLFKKLRNIDCYFADLDSPLADIKMDITNIKLSSEYFDVIICNHVLEHIPDDIQAMSELYRVLKTGAYAILQVPISYKIDETYEDNLIKSPEEREREFGQRDHVRIYGKDYIDRLQSVGFKVTIFDYNISVFADKKNKYSLAKDEKIFICEKV